MAYKVGYNTIAFLYALLPGFINHKWHNTHTTLGWNSDVWIFV